MQTVTDIRLDLTPPTGGTPISIDRMLSFKTRMSVRGGATFGVVIPPTPTNRGLLRHVLGYKAQIFHDDALQMTGLVDLISEDIGLTATDLHIEGRDMRGLLSDCIIPPDRLSIANRFLQNIAERWTTDLWPDLIPRVGQNLAASRYIASGSSKKGLTHTSIHEQGVIGEYTKYVPATTRSGGKGGKFGKDNPYYAGIGTEAVTGLRMKLGQLIWPSLEDLAAQIGCVATMGIDGVVQLIRPCYTFDSTAYGAGIELRYDPVKRRAKPGNVAGIRCERSIAMRRSTYHVAGVGRKSKKTRGADALLDGGVIHDVGPAFFNASDVIQLYKPGAITGRKIRNKKILTRLARRLVTEKILEGFSYEVQWPSFRSPSGSLWVWDTCSRVCDERNEIDDVYYIEEVERSFTHDEGRATKLKLFPRFFWLGDLDDPSIPDSQWYDMIKARLWW